MKKILLFLALIFLSVLQLAWPGFLYFFSCKPNLLLVFAVSLVFFMDFKTAFVFAVLAGLLKDLFLPGNFGLNTIFFAGWSYLIFRLSTQISTDNEYVRLFTVLAVVFLNNLLFGLIILNSGSSVYPGIFFRNLIIPSLYSVVLSPWIFKLIKKLS